jgi:molecular chaperone DnaK
LIFQSKKTLEDLSDKINEDEKNEIEGIIQTLSESHSKRDIESVKTQMDDLNSKFQSITQKIYENVNTEPTNDGEPSDVEFEEVK